VVVVVGVEQIKRHFVYYIHARDAYIFTRHGAFTLTFCRANHCALGVENWLNVCDNILLITVRCLLFARKNDVIILLAVRLVLNFLIFFLATV